MSQKRGFTLVELLVVIAIIGILVALLLPAIQAAREAARRTQCVNKLKQIGLAMQNHHDIRKKLPYGATCGSPAGTDCPQSGDVWPRYILPFLEESSLADKWQDARPYHDGTVLNSWSNALVIKTVIDSYLCPSDTPFAPWNSVPSYNYAVNVGNTDHRRNTVNTVVWGKAPFELRVYPASTTPIPDIDRNGVAYRLADITDGTSKTLLVAEVRQGQAINDLRGFIWYGRYSGFTTHYQPNTSSNDSVGGFCQDAVMRPMGMPCDNNNDLLSARSRHPGGINVMLGDASVRFVTNEIDLATWRNLSTMQDASVIGDY